MGVQEEEERAEHTTLGCPGVKSQGGGYNGAHPHNSSLASEKVLDPSGSDPSGSTALCQI